ncbi:MAG: single-stranded DNA-binding protein [Clostridia bacterium]|nr:single-stranded DNA-binding protein [Clostridia bacterium]
MNKAILIGRLTRDPETRTTQSGVTRTTFTLAVDRRFPNQQGVREADFINIVAWRQLADLCGRYLTKGRQAAVIGQIQTRSYDAQDGTKRYVTEVVADEVEFLGSKNDAPPRTFNEAPAEPAPDASAPGGTYADVDDDELPF